MRVGDVYYTPAYESSPANWHLIKKVGKWVVSDFFEFDNRDKELSIQRNFSPADATAYYRGAKHSRASVHLLVKAVFKAQSFRIYGKKN